MRELYTRGMTKIRNLIHNERGDILILSIFIIMGVTVLFAGMTEVGRVMIAKEQLQTAADAASLSAAASGTHRQVKIKVITDRGSRLQCDEDGNCWCSRCGTVTRGPFEGDETELLDQGGWRDYCVEPCPGCPGNDCWFELVDRDIMYDNQWMGSKMTETELNNSLNENTMYAKENLAWSVPERYEGIVKAIVRNDTLEEISKYLRTQIQWRQEWLITMRYNPTCNYNCSQYLDPYTKEVRFGLWSHYEECLRITSECNREAYKANVFYDQYGEKLKKITDRAIARNNKLIDTNTRRADPSGMLTSSVRDEFFEINLPKHAINSVIDDTKSATYEYNRKGAQSPYYPSVVVYATSEIKTLFAQWFGEQHWRTSVCSQSSTSFRDADDQIATVGYNRFHNSSEFDKAGRWNKIPKDACIK